MWYEFSLSLNFPFHMFVSLPKIFHALIGFTTQFYRSILFSTAGLVHLLKLDLKVLFRLNSKLWSNLFFFLVLRETFTFSMRLKQSNTSNWCIPNIVKIETKSAKWKLNLRYKWLQLRLVKNRTQLFSDSGVFDSNMRCYRHHERNKQHQNQTGLSNTSTTTNKK